MKINLEPNYNPAYYLLTAFFGLWLIVSCDDPATKQRWYVPDETKTVATVNDSGFLEGHWVCKDFIDLVIAKRSVKAVRNRPMFIELVFLPEYQDSVLLITAYQDFFVPFERDSTTVSIKNITPGSNLVLYAPKGAGEIMLTDTLENRGEKQVHNWVFVKAPAETAINNGRYTSAVTSAINQAVIAGTYNKPENGGTVTFAANGTLSGWPPYDRYRICAGGDCFQLTNTPFDIIQLIGSQGNEYFGLVVDAENMLKFYRLMEIKDTKKIQADRKKYAYEPGGLAYTLIVSK